MRPRTWAVTLTILALFLHLLPFNWLVFVPVIATWLFISIAISGFLMLWLEPHLDRWGERITEWLDR